MSTQPASSFVWEQAPSDSLKNLIRAHCRFQAAQPFLMLAVMLLVDMLAITTAAASSVLLWFALGRPLSLSVYGNLWPLLGLVLAINAVCGLYRRSPTSSVWELRTCTVAICLSFGLLAGVAFLVRGIEPYSRAIFLLAWASALVLVPLLRSAARNYLARTRWWGQPVIVFGSGRAGEGVIRVLTRHPELGLRPVALLSPDPWVEKPGSVPFHGRLDLAPSFVASGVQHAIIAAPDLSRDEYLNLLARCNACFSDVILVPDLLGFATLWVQATDLGGFLGLAVRQQLLLAGPRLLKRTLDLMLTVLGGSLISPLIVTLAVAVRLTSRGPAFYSQSRLGADGRPFRAWKFRSMVTNADAVLSTYLAGHPDARSEWERDQKLRNDPRVTPLGRWLRKTSLDELPQLWNVLRGEMSLVGPRPIVNNEVQRYGDAYSLYRRVRPGITGLWQVSGRNDVTYEERVAFDAYYVRNWSVWLDLHLLARTVLVVLRGKGAY